MEQWNIALYTEIVVNYYQFLPLWPLRGGGGMRQILAPYFKYLRCNSCWRPHFIVSRFLHAPIMEGRRWFNFKNDWRHLLAELTGQSPASPGIYCVASYFQRISCSSDTRESFHSNKDNQTFLVDLKLFLLLMLTVSVAGWRIKIISKPKWFGKNTGCNWVSENNEFRLLFKYLFYSDSLQSPLLFVSMKLFLFLFTWCIIIVVKLLLWPALISTKTFRELGKFCHISSIIFDKHWDWDYQLTLQFLVSHMLFVFDPSSLWT